jgi:hypothetical protein
VSERLFSVRIVDGDYGTFRDSVIAVPISNPNGSEAREMTGVDEHSPADPYSLQGPLLTWSGDMPIAIVFSEQAGEAEAKFTPDLILCLNLPKAALFRTIDECARFFEEA